MNKQQTLQEIYADLLPDEADPRLLQLVQDLESVCSAPPLPARLHWMEVRIMHNEQTFEKRAGILPFRPRAHQRLPLMRKAVLVPVLAALVLVTAAFTFTLTPLMRNLLSLEPSGQGLINSNLFVELHQSQTIDGLTFTLEEGYADSDQIILSYTVSPIKKHNNLLTANLSTQDGVQLPVLSGSGETDKYALGNAWFFDSSRIAGDPKTLPFQLKIQIGPVPTDTGISSKILGTVTFNFTLPFHPGKILTPGLQATSHGKTITLERVVVSRSATRLVVKGLVQDPSKKDAALLTLQVPGARNYRGYPDLSQFEANGSGTSWYVYFDDFSHNQGTWTLTIKQGIYTWVFHFVMPA